MADAGDVRRMRRILARVRAAGVVVREVPGWEARGATFEQVPCGIVDHHDASTRKSGEWGALGVITTGRPGIPGPLSQWQIARCLDGVPKLAVVAAGKANHAGRGGPRTVGGVHVPANGGNGLLYGAEKANDGLSEPHTPAAHYATDVLFAAVLAEVRGVGMSRLMGHKTWATPEGRKRDPVYDMAWRQARVAAVLNPPPPVVGPDEAEDDSTMRLYLVNHGDGRWSRAFLRPSGVIVPVDSNARAEALKAGGIPETVLTAAEFTALQSALKEVLG